MCIISIRISVKEEKLIREYAEMHNMTLSELFRSSVLEKIEDQIDLETHHQAMKIYAQSHSDISFDEMMKELDLNV